jgi:hypothetical protein
MDNKNILVIGGVTILAALISVAVIMMNKKKKVFEILIELSKDENKLSFKKFKEILNELEKNNKILEVLKKGIDNITEIKDDNEVKALSKDIIKILADNEGIPFGISYNNIDNTLCNKILIPHLRINALKKHIHSTATIPVSITNSQHKQQLLDLWHHFNPNTPIQFPDQQWCKHIPHIHTYITHFI